MLLGEVVVGVEEGQVSVFLRLPVPWPTNQTHKPVTDARPGGCGPCPKRSV